MNDLETIGSRIKPDDVGATRHEQTLEERVAILERKLDVAHNQIFHMYWRIVGLGFDMEDVRDEIDDLYYY